MSRRNDGFPQLFNHAQRRRTGRSVSQRLQAERFRSYNPTTIARATVFLPPDGSWWVCPDEQMHAALERELPRLRRLIPDDKDTMETYQ